MTLNTPQINPDRTGVNAPILILPKSAFKDGGRNPLRELFRQAGFDKIADADMGRRDQLEQYAGIPDMSDENDITIVNGEIRARFVKGSGRTATQMDLFRQSRKSPLFVTGGDVLMDAQAIASRNKDAVELQKVLDIGSGQCTLEILSPEESPITSLDQLSGRTVFTKYKGVARKLLEAYGIECDLYAGEGADTNIVDYREEGILNTAALEIVGSGATADKNKLTRFSIENSQQQGFAIDFNSVSTDAWIQNPDSLCDYWRSAYLMVCDALESSMQQATYSRVKFNVKGSEIDRYRSFGINGPTVNKVKTSDGEQWFACEVFVPDTNANATQTLFKRMGASGVGITGRNMSVGGDRQNSQAFKSFGR